MAYKIEQIGIISEADVAKLANAGVTTTDEILQKCAKAKGRTLMAEATGINRKVILKWTNYADLFRIEGIDSKVCQLLDATGINTLRELRNRVPSHLQPLLEQTNAMKKIVDRVPTLSEVEKLVAQAKTLKTIILY